MSKNKANLTDMKMQAANEVGVPLKDKGYNGDLTAKQVGSVGGQMVKKILPIGTLTFKRHIVPYLKGEYGFNFTYNIYVDM